MAMEQRASAHLEATFLALAHPARRAIRARLARGEASVSELAEATAWLDQTVITLIDFGSKEARDAAVATGMTDGMEQSYQLLEQVLSEKPRASPSGWRNRTGSRHWRTGR